MLRTLSEKQLLVTVHRHASPHRLVNGRTNVHHVRSQMIPLRLNSFTLQLLFSFVPEVHIPDGLIAKHFQLIFELLLLILHLHLELRELRVELPLQLVYHSASHYERGLHIREAGIHDYAHVHWVDINVSTRDMGVSEWLLSFQFTCCKGLVYTIMYSRRNGVVRLI